MSQLRASQFTFERMQAVEAALEFGTLSRVDGGFYGFLPGDVQAILEQYQGRDSLPYIAEAIDIAQRFDDIPCESTESLHIFARALVKCLQELEEEVEEDFEDEEAEDSEEEDSELA